MSFLVYEKNWGLWFIFIVHRAKRILTWRGKDEFCTNHICVKEMWKARNTLTTGWELLKCLPWHSSWNDADLDTSPLLINRMVRFFSLQCSLLHCCCAQMWPDPTLLFKLVPSVGNHKSLGTRLPGPACSPWLCDSQQAMEQGWDRGRTPRTSTLGLQENTPRPSRESLWWNCSHCAAKLHSLSFTSPNQNRFLLVLAAASTSAATSAWPRRCFLMLWTLSRPVGLPSPGFPGLQCISHPCTELL